MKTKYFKKKIIEQIEETDSLEELYAVLYTTENNILGIIEDLNVLIKNEQ